MTSPISTTNAPVQIAPDLTLDDNLYIIAAAVIWSFSTFGLVKAALVDEAR